MRRIGFCVGLLALAASLSGCRCFPGFLCYADFIDDLHDEQVLWDQWYHPRLDISRAGKPDWCGPVNRHLAPCRCDCVGEWDRANDCWVYPPGHPHWYPARTLGITTVNGPAAGGETTIRSTDAAPPAPPYEEPPPVLPPAPLPDAPAN